MYLFSASNIIKKDLIDYSSDEEDLYEEDAIDNEEAYEDQVNEDIQEMIVQCLETVNEVQNTVNIRTKTLLLESKLESLLPEYSQFLSLYLNDF